MTAITDIQQKILDTYMPFSPEKIILFGSYAKGDIDEFSDIDIIIVYKTEKRFMDRLRDLYMVWDLPKAVDILAYTPDEFDMMARENPFIQDAIANGKVLHA